ncbi:hypothetical protein [Gaoshiqia sp. Z1-71]|uniref:hypothetical protein n=1 Tax=Gaoshiqia hydrogeniformans TaxID=3290090 RepID=UPI003BF84260
MKFTQKDYDETGQLAELIKKIDHIDPAYVNTVSDEIFQRQPFFLSVLLGYQFDVSMEALEEIMKVYFLIWEYFRSNPNVQKKQVTQAFFEKNQAKNIGMLKYSEGEPNEREKMKVYFYDLQKLKSKALWTAVLYRCDSRPVLQKMNTEIKGIILIGMKSFIDCFETI